MIDCYVSFGSLEREADELSVDHISERRTSPPRPADLVDVSAPSPLRASNGARLLVHCTDHLRGHQGLLQT